MTAAILPAHAGPTVSIVVPVFNGARYLREALDSLLAQQYPHVEVIAVDDGSTDETPAILGTYADRVRVLRQDNRGQAAAMNAGWSASRGEVLSYLSADDRLRPEAVATAVQALERDTAALAVYGDYALIDPTSAPLRVVHAPPFVHAQVVATGECPPGPGVFIRREAHARAGPWDERLHQVPDLDYWMRLGLHGAIVHVPSVLAEFREHDASASFRAPSRARAEEPVTMYERFFSRQDLPATIVALRRVALAHVHLMASRSHLRAGRVRDASGHLLQACTLAPRSVATVRAARLLASGLFGAWRHRRRWRAS
jgi:glycosyltransferase involved in cell wall biosynthesis